MAMPDNPTERKKIIAMIILGVLLGAYLLINFLLLPYFATVREKRERVEELEHLIWRAETELQAVDRNMQRNASLVDELLDISERQRLILRPSLGNYLLVASEIMDRHADGLNLTLDPLTEPSRPSRQSSINEQQAGGTMRFRPYTVNATLTGGTHALVQFLRRLETSNPYLSITRLIIMEDPETGPDSHFFSLSVQWPIWVEPEFPRRLEAERIADEERR